MPHTFKLREGQFHDDDGGQVILRFKRDGNVVFAGVFDKLGKEVPEDREKIELSIVIKFDDKEIISEKVCTIIVNGVPQKVEC